MEWAKLLSPLRLGEKNTSEVTASHRTRFEQDYDRIIFSHPFRSLQDKTQVFPMPEDDFVHTRLTHSLEVSSVGRSLGRTVGEFIIKSHPSLASGGLSPYDFGAIVATACLTHDIGNPPFGHAGESTISDFFKNDPAGQFFKDHVPDIDWSDLTNFEGNAQGFRILTDPEYKGLKCTAATLATFTKYPRASNINSTSSRKSQKKYGFYQSNLSEFQEVAATCGLLPLGEHSWIRHPLAFLVEAADDICYLIIDLEDGTRLGLIPFEQTRDLLSEIIGDRYDPGKLREINSLDQKLGTLRALAIQQLIQDTAKVFLTLEKDLLTGTFDQALTDQLPYANTLKTITKLSIEHIYRSKQVIQREAMGLEVLSNILRQFTTAMFQVVFNAQHSTSHHQTIYRLLPGNVRHQLERPAITIYQGVRIILDFVAGMTDRSAVKMHRILTGQITVF